MTRATSLKGNTLSVLPEEVIFLYMYVFLTYTNVPVLGYKVLFFILFFLLPHMDLPFPFISNHKSS